MTAGTDALPGRGDVRSRSLRDTCSVQHRGRVEERANPGRDQRRIGDRPHVPESGQGLAPDAGKGARQPPRYLARWRQCCPANQQERGQRKLPIGVERDRIREQGLEFGMHLSL